MPSSARRKIGPDDVDVSALFRVGAVANELRESVERYEPFDALPVPVADASQLEGVLGVIEGAVPASLHAELVALMPDMPDQQAPAGVYALAARRIFGWCNGLVQSLASGAGVWVTDDSPAASGVAVPDRAGTQDDGSAGGGLHAGASVPKATAGTVSPGGYL